MNLSRFQIYKKYPPYLQNVTITNASKELPNHERAFDIHLQYLKQNLLLITFKSTMIFKVHKIYLLNLE